MNINRLCGLIGFWLVLSSSLAFGSRLTQVLQSSTDLQEQLNNTIQSSSAHQDILTTVFWVGEKAKPNSGWSDNLDSAWDMRWKENFGGLDSPIYRKGFFPARFRPKQNPFYVALPFNDISNPGYLQTCPILQHFKKNRISQSASVCKNRWIEIKFNGKACYAQWQDVGPVYTNDHDYVFGGQKPKAENKDMAGLDVSPAVRDFLFFNGVCRSTWRFVEEAEVAEGPWKSVITRS
jgi:hypothetical protein